MEKRILEILEKYWGYASLRPAQEEIIKAVLDNVDVLAMLPTGGGKSLCFQLPALIKGGVAIVVSPLIALMQDQVHGLKSKGVNAFYINSSLTKSEQEVIVGKIQKLDTAILYLSPEKLNSEWFQEKKAFFNISMVAIDEAHCISQWGYDFRPEYSKLEEILAVLDVPVIALTATATEEVRSEIVTKLGLIEPKVFVNGVCRENLKFSIRNADAKESLLASEIENTTGATIIYCRTRKSCEEVSSYLIKQGCSATVYHAGKSKLERLTAQELFLNNKVQIIVATSAFGMGVDKPDVRKVIHFGAPNSLEAYYQEVGRAGRDGELSDVVLLNGAEDEKFSNYLMQNKYPEVHVIRSVYDGLCNQLRVAYDFFLEGYHELDIGYLKAKTGLDFLPIHYSLRMLDLSKLLDYQQEFYTPSSLQFIISPEILHDSYKEDSVLESVVKSIIRVLGTDVFYEPQKINETTICNMSGVSQQKLHDVINYLLQKRMIRYYKGTDKPVVKLLTRRKKKAPVNQRLMTFLKESESMKLNEMYAFVHSKECRQVVVSRYFGFETENCNTCDNCIRNSNEKNAFDFNTLFNESGTVSLSELRQKLHNYTDTDFSKLVEELVSQKKISRMPSGEFKFGA